MAHFRMPRKTIGVWASLAALACAPAHAATDIANSPDQRFVAKIVEVGAGDENGSGSQALVLFDRTSGTERRLLVSKWSDDYHLSLANLSHPLFSLGGNFIYFTSSDVSPNSAAIHQINLTTRMIRFVRSGMALRVIRTGPYRGYLLVQVHQYYDRPSGGSYNPVILVRPDGHDEFVIPGSEIDSGEAAIEPWLARNGWQAW